MLCEEYTTTASYVQFTARFVYTDGGGSENSVNLVAGERASYSLTPQKEVDYLILRVIRTAVVATTTGKVSDIQIEEGSVSTEYQPYNGQIVHEEQIADVEHIETIYDMSSSDSNINWGYTGGLLGETTVNNKNFSKYKKLKVYCNAGRSNFDYCIDLIKKLKLITLNGYAYGGGGEVPSFDVIENTTKGISYVSSDKTTFFHYLIGFTNTSGWQSRNNDANFLVYKIEGVY